MRAFVVALALLTAGCTSTNISELVKSLSGDSATACITATYAGALINVARTNITNGDVSCNANGLTVKSSSTTIPIPVNVQAAPVK